MLFFVLAFFVRVLELAVIFDVLWVNHIEKSVVFIVYVCFFICHLTFDEKIAQIVLSKKPLEKIPEN